MIHDDLRSWTVKQWLKDKRDGAENELTENDDNGGRILDKTRAVEQKFVISLPTVESHYCRKFSTTKFYLERIWTSETQNHIHHSAIWYKEKNLTALSMCSFHKIYIDLNIAFISPKKINVANGELIH